MGRTLLPSRSRLSRRAHPDLPREVPTWNLGSWSILEIVIVVAIMALSIGLLFTSFRQDSSLDPTIIREKIKNDLQAIALDSLIQKKFDTLSFLQNGELYYVTYRADAEYEIQPTFSQGSAGDGNYRIAFTVKKNGIAISDLSTEGLQLMLQTVSDFSQVPTSTPSITATIADNNLFQQNDFLLYKDGKSVSNRVSAVFLTAKNVTEETASDLTSVLSGLDANDRLDITFDSLGNISMKNSSGTSVEDAVFSLQQNSSDIGQTLALPDDIQ